MLLSKKIKKIGCSLFFLLYNFILLADLSQSKFPLHFNHGAYYNIFDRQDAKGTILLEWNLEKNSKERHFCLRVQAREVPFSFVASNNQKLNACFFISDQFDHPISFLENNNSNLTWEKKESGGSLVCFPISVSLPAKQLVAPGEYKCYLELTLLSQDLKVVAEQLAELVVTVLPAQKIFILLDGKKQGSGKTLRLDFSATTDNATRTFQIEVIANVPCEVLCKSLNGGNLIMQPNCQKKNYGTIEMLYNLSFQGRKIDLRNGNTFLLHHPLHHCIKAVKYPLALTVQPNLEKNWEGIYEDDILFSIRSAF